MQIQTRGALVLLPMLAMLVIAPPKALGQLKAPNQLRAPSQLRAPNQLRAPAQLAPIEDRNQARQEYRTALQYLKSNRITRYRKLKPRLESYPLYPYLEYQEMLQGMRRRTEADISAFVEQYQDTPLAAQLSQAWLAHLAKRKRWQDFLRYYEVTKRPPLSRELACQHAVALHQAGQREAASTRTLALWLVAYSQPEECDPLFDRWRAQGGITREVAWQRFAICMRANQRRLAVYLLRFIDAQDKPAAVNFLALRDRPARIKQQERLPTQSPRSQEMILYGVTRYARRAPEAALALLRTYTRTHALTPESLVPVYVQLAQYLAQQTDIPVFSIDSPVNLHAHPQVLEESIRQALRLLNWQEVLVGIALLPPAWQAGPRWRYWKARALRERQEALAMAAPYQARRTAKEAKKILLALSEERSFYGFLAADLRDRAYAYQAESSGVTQEQVLSLALSPGMQRALELFVLGERNQARKAWRFTTAAFTSHELEVAATLAFQRRWYKVAIQAMIDAGGWNYLDIRFPLAWDEHFSTYAAEADIPLPWSLAIARVESAFMPDAKSPSGALGLMQILPTTATMITRRMKVKYRHWTNLIRPEFNIKLGTRYLGRLFRRFDQNRILASAAYNAGPRRVAPWLSRKLPLDVWIEVIPINETRTYVQNILIYSNIYSRRLGKPAPLIFPHEGAFFVTLE